MDGSREYYAVTSFRRKGKDIEWFHSCIKNTPSKRVTKATELELIHKRESMRWGWGLDGKDHCIGTLVEGGMNSVTGCGIGTT